MTIELVVMHVPTGKARARTVRNKWGKAHSFTPRKTVEFEDAIRNAWYMQSRKKLPDDMPLTLRAIYYMPIPKSLSKKKRLELINTPHVVKPDADNITKAVQDALNGFAYTDDSKICCNRVIKLYSETPRVVICLSETQLYGDLP